MYIYIYIYTYMYVCMYIYMRISSQAPRPLGHTISTNRKGYTLHIVTNWYSVS